MLSLLNLLFCLFSLSCFVDDPSAAGNSEVESAIFDKNAKEVENANPSATIRANIEDSFVQNSDTSSTSSESEGEVSNFTSSLRNKLEIEDTKLKDKESQSTSVNDIKHEQEIASSVSIRSNVSEQSWDSREGKILAITNGFGSLDDEEAVIGFMRKQNRDFKSKMDVFKQLVIADTNPQLSLLIYIQIFNNYFEDKEEQENLYLEIVQISGPKFLNLLLKECYPSNIAKTLSIVAKSKSVENLEAFLSMEGVADHLKKEGFIELKSNNRNRAIDVQDLFSENKGEKFVKMTLGQHLLEIAILNGDLSKVDCLIKAGATFDRYYKYYYEPIKESITLCQFAAYLAYFYGIAREEENYSDFKYKELVEITLKVIGSALDTILIANKDSDLEKTSLAKQICYAFYGDDLPSIDSHLVMLVAFRARYYDEGYFANKILDLIKERSINFRWDVGEGESISPAHIFAYLRDNYDEGVVSLRSSQLNLLDYEGLTPFMIMVKMGKIELLSQTLKRMKGLEFIKMCQKDSNGNTLAKYLSDYETFEKHQNLKGFQELILNLDNKIDGERCQEWDEALRLKNNEGKSAFEVYFSKVLILGTESPSASVLKMLLTHVRVPIDKVYINIDEKSENLFDYLAINGNLDIFKIILPEDELKNNNSNKWRGLSRELFTLQNFTYLNKDGTELKLNAIQRMIVDGKLEELKFLIKERNFEVLDKKSYETAAIKTSLNKKAINPSLKKVVNPFLLANECEDESKKEELSLLICDSIISEYKYILNDSNSSYNIKYCNNLQFNVGNYYLRQSFIPKDLKTKLKSKVLKGIEEGQELRKQQDKK